MKNIFNRKNLVKYPSIPFWEAIHSVLNHELRTPLMTIKSGISLIEENMEKIAEVNNETMAIIRRSLSNIDSETVAANFFINLISGMMNTNLNRENTEQVDLNDILLGAIKRFPSQLKNQAIDFEINSSGKKYSINGDKKNLEMVFCSLFYDAVIRGSKKDALSIEIVLAEEPKYFCVTMTDNAKVIDPKERAVLFNRICSLNRELSLGLYFCKRAMKKMGGTIQFDLTDTNKTICCLKFSKPHKMK